MRHEFSIFRRLRRCEDGATAIEFAFIGMVMIILSLGLIEFGRGFYLYNKLSFAVDLAARMVLTKPEIADQALKDEVSAAFTGEKPSPVVTITSGSTGTGTSLIKFKTIVISLPFRPLVPNIVRDTINLRVSRRIPIIL